MIVDEINTIPNRVLIRMKEDWNVKVGQEVTVQEDSDKRLPVGKRFSWGATANVKGEKHPDREELDDAIVRVFDSKKIEYFPPHELYDIMLAQLMDIKGGAIVSFRDANDTLSSLCSSVEWIQKAYQGEKVVISSQSGEFLTARGQASIGKEATLRKAILDPGKASGMLNGWEDSRRKGLTLGEHLNQKIIDSVNNENYPEEDRYYLIEIFALQGFLKGVDVKKLNVGNLDQDTLDAWNGYDGKRYVSKVNYIPARVVSKLDPYGRLGSPITQEALDLLDETEEGEDIEDDQETSGTGFTTIATRSTKVDTRVPKPDAEGQKEIDELDKEFPPTALPEDYSGYYDYCPRLVEIALKNPTTAGAVFERFLKRGEQTTKNHTYGITFTSGLYKFLARFKDNVSFCQRIIPLVDKWDQDIKVNPHYSISWSDQVKTLESIKKLAQETLDAQRRSSPATIAPDRSIQIQPDAEGQKDLDSLDNRFPLDSIGFSSDVYFNYGPNANIIAGSNPTTIIAIAERYKKLVTNVAPPTPNEHNIGRCMNFTANAFKEFIGLPNLPIRAYETIYQAIDIVLNNPNWIAPDASQQGAERLGEIREDIKKVLDAKTIRAKVQAPRNPARVSAAASISGFNFTGLTTVPDAEGRDVLQVFNKKYPQIPDTMQGRNQYLKTLLDIVGENPSLVEVAAKKINEIAGDSVSTFPTANGDEVAEFFETLFQFVLDNKNQLDSNSAKTLKVSAQKMKLINIPPEYASQISDINNTIPTLYSMLDERIKKS